MSVPTWADEFRKIPAQEGGGKWRTSTVEVARGPMLAVTEPGVHTITAMTATQILKSSLLLSVVGYFAHLDPAPMMLVQPKDDAADAFSKERITPFITATPVLRNLIGTRKTRSKDESIGYKPFPGGFLAIVGAGSPTNLASRPIRVAMYDETDKYEATREGDAFTLGDERLARFNNWLSIRVCSPTFEDDSLIYDSYQEGDHRQASLVCPHCGHRTFPDFFKHVDWTKDKDASGNTVRHHPKTARFYCEACGSAWDEGDRLRALASARWHQTRPFECCGEKVSPLAAYEAAWRARYDGNPDEEQSEAAVAEVWDWWTDPTPAGRWAVYRCRCPKCGTWPVSNDHASFQASKLFSPWSKDRMAEVARKLIAAKGNEEREQGWWNTQMGLPYRRKAGKEVAVDTLMARREVYPAEIPDGTAVLTFGADTQDDRVEIEVIGWGRDEESWSIAYEVFWGDPEQPEFWERVDEFLLRTWRRADGREFRIEAGCFDSGGHHTQAVYSFCKARAGRNIWAIRGDNEQTGVRSPVWPPMAKARRSRATGFRPITIGTNAAKDTLSARLQIAAPGPGYMHWPTFWDRSRFEQLTAEKLDTRKTKNGRPYRVWVPKQGRSNEALDCRVYGYAALCGLLHRGLKLNKRATEVGARSDGTIVLAGTDEAERLEAERKAAPPAEAPPAEPKKKKPPRVGRSSYMQRIGR